MYWSGAGSDGDAEPRYLLHPPFLQGEVCAWRGWQGAVDRDEGSLYRGGQAVAVDL